MKAMVTANKLNIRDYPGLSGAKVGLLTRDTLVTVLDQGGEWLQIKMNGWFGFVHADYVMQVPEPKRLKGKVTAGVLNVRGEPDIESERIGTLARNTVVDIEAEHGDWMEIRFNDTPAYVAGAYVQTLDATGTKEGLVSARTLNVRKQPSLRGEKAGTLGLGAPVGIHTTIGRWHEITFNDAPAYVHSEFVDVTGETEDAAHAEADAGFLFENEKLQQVTLEPEPEKQLAGGTRAIEKQVARTWNQYGNLLTLLSRAAGIDTGLSVAVLNVESAGHGFARDGRMVVRFENHKFWKYWGKDHTEQFRTHFKYRNDKVWLGHQFKAGAQDEWEKVHTSQNREWQVLDFARGLDEAAALKSISMGAPQIMGFHHARIGYPSVQEMFDNFDEGIRFHILGFFDFFDDRMVRALQRQDLVTFAGFYNGTGKAEDYGGKIKQQFEVFQRLAA